VTGAAATATCVENSSSRSHKRDCVKLGLLVLRIMLVTKGSRINIGIRICIGLLQQGRRVHSPAVGSVHEPGGTRVSINNSTLQSKTNRSISLVPG
jgi:hypothetical protein